MKDIKNPYFLYVGNAYPHKNLNRLIKAVKELNGGGEKVHLLIASSRDVFTKRLESKIKKLDASAFVKLLGFVPDRELPSLYKNSVAFTFPSLSEGFGLPGLEAMNAGTLVAASDIPVFREVYEDNAIYFNPFDPISIKETLKGTLKMDKETRQKMIEKSQKFIKKYSWAKMAEETLEIYRKSARFQ